MADLVAVARTNLAPEDVIVRAVQFFTNEKWRPTTQSARIATFQGRPPIPIGHILLTIVGFLFFIIPGIILYILLIRKMIRFQNIVVTANPLTSGSEVTATYPKHVKKLVDRFVNSLPPGS